jgi:hypothetical protein
MRPFGRLSLAVLLLVALSLGGVGLARTQTATPGDGASQAAAPPAPAFRLSGCMFGDFFWVAGHHDPAIEGQNGFWFRRIYFTYDHTLSPAFSTRFRLELNSAGDFRTNAKLTPYVKDAYLRWTRRGHSVLVGISPTPTWEVIEAFWGYRSVEKTPLDLQRFDASRDFGVALMGGWGPEGRVRYHVMVGNGSDTGSETDKSKALRASLGYRGRGGVLLEAYADWQDRPGRADRSTWQAFAGYQRPEWRVAVQVAQQARRSATSGPTARLELLSGFAAAQVAQKAWVYGRVDRMFDPNPEGDKIPYLPFDPRARSLLVVFGVDVAPEKSVHFMPNLELVRYDGAPGLALATDIVPRITFYYVW